MQPATTTSSAGRVARRRFLCNAAMVLGTGLALPMFVPGSALGADGKVAPSDRLGIGFIGLGRQAVHANMSVFLRSGYRCRARWGQLAADLYSVQHIARLLGDKYPALSFAELDKWLRTVVRDEELANRVAQTIEEQASNRDKVLRVKTLLEERLSQCKSLRTAQIT